MKYAFGYVRVSTEEQTILNQKLAIKKWALDNDYEILDFFETLQSAERFRQLTEPDLENY